MSRKRTRPTPVAVAFGTWGWFSNRPRTVFAALEHRGWRIARCHGTLFESTSAKLEVFGGAGLLRFLLRAAVVCPGLVLRALARVPFDCMLVTCGGYVDILMALVPARVAGAALVFDPLFGLYETVVEDRGLVRRGTLAAWMVAGIERLCYRMADVVLTDTEEHRRYVLGRIGLSPRRVFVVPVGAEDDLFYPRAGPARRDGRRAVEILFYGSMIPLHGADTIIRAASRVRDASSRFTLVGHGQTSDTVETLARDLDCRNVRFVPPVAYHRVPELIAAADICLGIFGTTRKAQDIVPTKVFECLAMAKPVVTGDTPATRRLFRPGEHLVTVPCGDAGALAEALERLARDPPRRQALGRAGRAWYEAHFAKAALARRLQPIEAWIR